MTFSVSKIFYSKPWEKKNIRSGNFSPFLFHFLHIVNFIGRKVKALVIKRFDQFTLACLRSSHVFNYQDNTSENLYRRTSVSDEYVSTEFNCWRISVIVHRSANNKLAVDSLVLLVCGLSLIPPGKFFPIKDLWTRVWQTLQVFVYTQLYAPYKFICAYRESFGP